MNNLNLSSNPVFFPVTYYTNKHYKNALLNTSQILIIESFNDNDINTTDDVIIKTATGAEYRIKNTTPMELANKMGNVIDLTA